MEFLLMLKYDGRWHSSVVSANRLIEIDNMWDIYSDCYDDYRAYLLGDEVKEIHSVGWMPNCEIIFVDDEGNEIIHGFGEDH